MKLKYHGKRKLIMFPDHNLWAEDGLEVMVKSNETQERYKEVGFKEVKQTKKEGDK